MRDPHDSLSRIRAECSRRLLTTRSRSGGFVQSETNAWITSWCSAAGHLEKVLRGYVAHYNAERPHRSLHLVPPAGLPQIRGSPPNSEILRRDVLGGLIHEYYAAAA